MIKLYIENNNNNNKKRINISKENALEATSLQCLDVLDSIKYYEDAVLGLIVNKKEEIVFISCNRFIWKITIKNKSNIVIFCSKNKCISFIKKIFEDPNILVTENFF